MPNEFNDFIESEFMAVGDYFIPKSQNNNNLRHFGIKKDKLLYLRFEEVLYLYSDTVPLDSSVEIKAYFEVKNADYNIIGIEESALNRIKNDIKEGINKNKQENIKNKLLNSLIVNTLDNSYANINDNRESLDKSLQTNFAIDKNDNKSIESFNDNSTNDMIDDKSSFVKLINKSRSLKISDEIINPENIKLLNNMNKYIYKKTRHFNRNNDLPIGIFELKNKDDKFKFNDKTINENSILDINSSFDKIIGVLGADTTCFIYLKNINSLDKNINKKLYKY